MMQRLARWFVDFWIVMAFGVAAALVVPQAHAAMIGTDSAQAQDERARVKAMLERPELAKGLEKMGLTPTEAVARVYSRTLRARAASRPRPSLACSCVSTSPPSDLISTAATRGAPKLNLGARI